MFTRSQARKIKRDGQRETPQIASESDSRPPSFDQTGLSPSDVPMSQRQHNKRLCSSEASSAPVLCENSPDSKPDLESLRARTAKSDSATQHQNLWLQAVMSLRETKSISSLLCCPTHGWNVRHPRINFNTTNPTAMMSQTSVSHQTVVLKLLQQAINSNTIQGTRILKKITNEIENWELISHPPMTQKRGMN